MKHIKILLIALFISLCYSGYGQTTIYSEDFSGQANKGAFYDAGEVNGIGYDVSGLDWSIDMANASFNSAADKFSVTGGARYLEGRDLSTHAIWYSPTMNISGYTNVGFSLEASESSPGTLNLEITDTIVTEYSTDGGTTWIQVGMTNGTIQGEIPSTLTVSHPTSLGASTIQLRVTMTNDGNGERQRIDNILIEGTAPTGPIVIVNPSGGISGLSTVENNVPLISETFTVEAFGLTVGTDVDIVSQNSRVVFATVANGPYTSSLALPTTAGDLANTTIYVQAAFGLPVATNAPESIVVSGTPLLFFDTFRIINVTVTTVAHTPAAACSELLISEYHESNGGSNRENYIELYNPTGTAIDLSNYQIARFRNGRVNYRPDIRNLGGSIAPYSTYLIARTGSDKCTDGTADYCNNASALRFDGNDPIALQDSNGVNIDVLGALTSSTIYGRNTTGNLRRNHDVQAPVVTYDAASEWTAYSANNITMLGFHLNACRCTGTTTTYTGGAWDNGAPTATSNAIIDDDYDTSVVTAGITACSLTINSGVTLTLDGDYTVDVDFHVVNNGTISVTTDGAFVQNDDDARFINIVGSGTSSVTKQSAVLNSLAEYTYWSSPVQGEVVGDVFPSIHQDRRYWFDASNFLDATMENNNDNTTVAGQDEEDDNGDDWQVLSTASTLEAGFGFITYPEAGSYPGPTPEYTFTGPFNTGTIAVPVYKNDSELADDNINLIGNPYPSAVDADAFFAENVTSTGVIEPIIYLWSHDSPVSATTNGNQDANYGNADYALISGSGELAGGDGVIPTRFIPSGQGFVVHFSDSSTGDISEGGDIYSNNVIFNNAMRATGNNTQFFKSSNSQNTTSNKLWFNLTSDNGINSQILISYLDGATTANDGTYYDTQRNTLGYNACIYSTISGDNEKFSIQGKSSGDLTLNEEIPLGIYTIIDVPTVYTISIAQLEGTFATSNTIFLKDTLLNTTHNLSSNDYSFTSATGEFNERFKIVFTTNTLSTDSFDTISQTLSIVELQGDNVQFTIPSNELTIKSVKILDLLGRTVYNFKGRESTEVYNLANVSSSIYVAQIELSNGTVISKKAIKK